MTHTDTISKSNSGDEIVK